MQCYENAFVSMAEQGGGVLAVLHPNGIGVTQERGVLSVGHNQQTFNLQKADIHEYLYHE